MTHAFPYLSLKNYSVNMADAEVYEVSSSYCAFTWFIIRSWFIYYCTCFFLKPTLSENIDFNWNMSFSTINIAIITLRARILFWRFFEWKLRQWRFVDPMQICYRSVYYLAHICYTLLSHTLVYLQPVWFAGSRSTENINVNRLNGPLFLT